DVAHAFDEKPVDVDETDGPVRPGRVARQVVVDVQHAKRNHAWALGRRVERAANDSGPVNVGRAGVSRRERLDARPCRAGRATRLHAEAPLSGPEGRVRLTDGRRAGDARLSDRVSQTAARLDVLLVNVSASPVAISARKQ